MKITLKNLSLIILSTALLSISSNAFSRDVRVNASEKNHPLFDSWFSGDKSGVAAITDSLYLDKCGSCHFAYQPGLLPIASWERTMSNLKNHFGKNIELTDDELATIRNLLLDNAAGRTTRKISIKLVRSLHDGQVPLRVSEIPFFIQLHKKALDSSKVKSISHCDSCHLDANKGKFDTNNLTP